MATTTHPLAQTPQASTRMLGESTAVVSSGAWFSAVTSAAFADMAAEAHDAGARELVLDLTDVRAVDAAGTATLGALAEQLAPDGRLVAPLSIRGTERLVLLRRTPEGFTREDLEEVRFVPLV